MSSLQIETICVLFNIAFLVSTTVPETNRSKSDSIALAPSPSRLQNLSQNSDFRICAAEVST